MKQDIQKLKMDLAKLRHEHWKEEQRMKSRIVGLENREFINNIRKAMAKA